MYPRCPGLQHISSGRGILHFSIVSFRPVESVSNNTTALGINVPLKDDSAYDGSVDSDRSGDSSPNDAFAQNQACPILTPAPMGAVAASTAPTYNASHSRRNVGSGLAGQVSEHMLGRRNSGNARTFHDLATAIVEVQRQMSNKTAEGGVRHQHSGDANNSLNYPPRQAASVGSHVTTGKKTMGRLRRALENQVRLSLKFCIMSLLHRARVTFSRLSPELV